MLLEELKTLAANLYKEAEEATPIVGDGEKNEWMAHRLDEIIEENGAALNCLLQFNLISEVTDFLEQQYEDRKDKNIDQDLSCDSRAKENDRIVSTPLQNVRRSNDNIVTDSELVDEPVVVIEEDILIVGDANDMTQKNTCR